MNSRLIDWLCLLSFGLASSVACVVTAREIGATYDEPIYLKCGMQFWRTGSHRELMKLGTMPLPVDLQTMPIGLAEKLRGQQYDLDADFRTLLVWMRHGNLVFWWLLLAMAGFLARDLGGPWAGRLAIAGLSCEPNLLAHASLATTDIAITATLLAFAVAYRRGIDRETRARVVIPGLLYGVALLAKASALAFGPIIMLAIELTRSTDRPLRERIRGFVGDGWKIGVIGLLVALVGCGSDFEPSGGFVLWAKALPEGPSRTAWVWIAKNLKVFGNAFEAIGRQIQHNARGHGQFLLGERDYRPFWWYFPMILLIKLPLVTLAGSAWLAISRPRMWVGNAALLAATFLTLFSLNCRVQLGIRMQLPLVAMLGVGLAVVVVQLGWRWRLAGVAGVATCAAISVLAVPYQIMYSNRLWGGWENTYLVAGDSNSDWGQGLPDLERWHAANGRPGLDIWYFGQDPMIEKMNARHLPLHCVPLETPDDMRQFVWGRTLAVATNISHGYRLSRSHNLAMEYIQRRQPIARTRTFLIYSFADVPPPERQGGS